MARMRDPLTRFTKAWTVIAHIQSMTQGEVHTVSEWDVLLPLSHHTQDDCNSHLGWCVTKATHPTLV